MTIALPEEPMFGISLEDGENYRAMNILVALWLIVFSIPTFLWLNKDNRKKKINITLIKDSFNQLRGTFKRYKENKKYNSFFSSKIILQ